MSGAIPAGPRQAMTRGIIDVAPIVPGVLPFGLVAGLLPVEAGYSPALSVAMSVLVFAGAAQLAMIQLVSQGEGLLTVVLTAWVINARFAMYSASLAPYFATVARRWRLAAAYFLTDQAYAMSVLTFGGNFPTDLRLWYFLGSGLTMWTTWQIATVLGAFLGTGIPAGWSIDFVIPLMFLGLLIRSLSGRALLAAALVSAVVATLARLVTPGLAILLGAFCGIVAGYAWPHARETAR